MKRYQFQLIDERSLPSAERRFGRGEAIEELLNQHGQDGWAVRWFTIDTHEYAFQALLQREAPDDDV